MSTPQDGPSAQQEEQPVCPRHLQRASYVRCQRCGRPTCPECQRPAAVGIQCIDCVRDGAASVRTSRTQFGAPVSTGRPVVTLTIVVVCVLVWLAQKSVPGTTERLEFVSAAARSEPWRFLTAAFAHSPTSITHILFNLFALWQIGQYLEPLIGRARFAALYLISAVGGSVGYLLLTPLFDNEGGALYVHPGTVGASGAVFGLFAAMLVLNRHLGRSSAGIAAVIVINAVIGFVIPGIAWQAHLGGAVTGACCALVLARTAAAPRRRLQWPGLALVLIIVVAAAVARYASIGSFSLV